MKKFKKIIIFEKFNKEDHFSISRHSEKCRHYNAFLMQKTKFHYQLYCDTTESSLKGL